jgi:hypothetical protein
VGLSFTIAAGPLQSPARLVTIFYCLRFETPPTWRAVFISPRNRVAQLYLQALGSNAESITCPRYITPGRTEKRSPFPTVPLLFLRIRCCGNVGQFHSKALVSTSLSAAAKVRLANRCLVMDVFFCASLTAHFRRSDVISQYIAWQKKCTDYKFNLFLILRDDR